MSTTVNDALMQYYQALAAQLQQQIEAKYTPEYMQQIIERAQQQAQESMARMMQGYLNPGTDTQPTPSQPVTPQPEQQPETVQIPTVVPASLQKLVDFIMLMDAYQQGLISGANAAQSDPLVGLSAQGIASSVTLPEGMNPIPVFPQKGKVTYSSLDGNVKLSSKAKKAPIAIQGDVNAHNPQDANAAVSLNGVANGGYVGFFRSPGDTDHNGIFDTAKGDKIATQTSPLEINVAGAASGQNDSVNLYLNADLLPGKGVEALYKVAVPGLENVTITARDGIPGIAYQMLDAENRVREVLDGNAPNVGYALDLSKTDALKTLTVLGSSLVSLSFANAPSLEKVNASESVGDFILNLSQAHPAQHVQVLGSVHGQNLLVGSDSDAGETLWGGHQTDVLVGGAGSDELIGNGGHDVFVFGDDSSTIVYMDVIRDFGKVTQAMDGNTLASTQLPSVSTGPDAQVRFLESLSSILQGKGGDEADVLYLQPGSTFSTHVASAAQGDNFTVNSNGILVVKDPSKLATLDDWLALLNQAAAHDGDTVATELGGNTYVFQQRGDHDVVVELTGVTGVTGLATLGSNAHVAPGMVLIA